jgi:hypothetical protein
MNRQALKWATVRMEKRPQTKAKIPLSAGHEGDFSPHSSRAHSAFQAA